MTLSLKYVSLAPKKNVARESSTASGIDKEVANYGNDQDDGTANQVINN